MGIDLYEIRRERLRTLIKEEAGDNQAEFARLTLIKASQISRWLSKNSADPRNIDEISAQKLEDRFCKPRGWMSGLNTAGEPETSLYRVQHCRDTRPLTQTERDLIDGFHSAPIETQAFWLNQARYYIELKRDFEGRSEQ